MGKGKNSMARVMARLVLGVVAALALGACQTVRTTQGGVVGVDRAQTMSPLVSSAQVDKMSLQQYNTTVADAENKGKLNRDPQQVKRVRGIGQRLIAQTGTFRPDARNWQWEINVITSDELNAWCMPGGKIAVYTALIERLQLTDGELAAVMGHEISHALREHSREKMSKAVPAQVLMSVVGVAYGDGAAQLGGQAYSQIVFLESETAFKAFTSGKFEFGAEASAVAITAAASAKANTAGASATATPMPSGTNTRGRSQARTCQSVSARYTGSITP